MGAEGDLEGELTIEGPVLEAAYSAFCVTKGEDIVPRKETLGVTHDLMLRGDKGYVFCELDGSGSISENKIKMFRDDVLKLNSLLKEDEKRPISEARFLTMLPRGYWGEEVSKLMDSVLEDFKKESISLRIVEPKRLLYDLIISSAVGFIVYDDSILLVGPNHWAIRYDSSISRFVFGGSPVDPNKYRAIPQSFIPWDYWDNRHSDLFTQYANMCQESPPEWLNWQFPVKFGIKWRSNDQILEAVEKDFSKQGRAIVCKDDKGFVVEERIQRTSAYVINVVHKSRNMLAEDADEVNEAFFSLGHRLVESEPNTQDANLRFRLFVDTVTFSHSFWTRIKFVGDKQHHIYVEILRGEDLLIDSLNKGVVGLKADKNHIKLTLEQGPDIMNIVRGSLQWEASKEGTYPATLKF